MGGVGRGRKLAREVKSSPEFEKFRKLISETGVPGLFDFHLHICGGKGGARGDASPEDLSELPEEPFALEDADDFYAELFEGRIEIHISVFDTPLLGYDIRARNRKLLEDLRRGRQFKASFWPFAIVTPDMRRGEVEELVELGAKGFKITPRIAPSYRIRRRIKDVSLREMLSEDLCSAASEHALPVLIHPPLQVAEPEVPERLKEDLLGILERFPKLRVILAHLGCSHTVPKLHDWADWIQSRGLSDRVFFDASTITYPETLKEALSLPLRILFGTDIDFCLVERGLYLAFEQNLALSSPLRRASVHLVSSKFGGKYREALPEPPRKPLLLFQLEAICEAYKLLKQDLGAEKAEKIFRDFLFESPLSIFRNPPGGSSP